MKIAAFFYRHTPWGIAAGPIELLKAFDSSGLDFNEKGLDARSNAPSVWLSITSAVSDKNFRLLEGLLRTQDLKGYFFLVKGRSAQIWQGEIDKIVLDQEGNPNHERSVSVCICTIDEIPEGWWDSVRGILKELCGNPDLRSGGAKIYSA